MNIYSSKPMAYVYMCVHKNTNKFYIGYRSTNVKLNRPSHIDLPKYKSSNPKIKKNFSDYDWTIIAEFFEADFAYDFEQQLIFDNWDNPLLINKSCFHLKNRFKSKPLTPEHKRAISAAQSKPKTNAHKEKLSLANKGCRWYNNGSISVQSKYQPDGFIPGRLITSIEGFTPEKARQAGKKNLGKKQKIAKCPHCGTQGGVSTLKQHHFDKCTSLNKFSITNIVTGENIEISKKSFKEIYGAPLYLLLNGHVKRLKGWIIQS